ncbi:MAG: cupin domain-containing protein [Scytonematopsis contorta HA4267-MV1]|jgi:ribosomal protein L16 Arg81 hydroxylase|nr:cupin domain-containing protein [Scytonematopsis contorta HA4267-MV1]
MKLYSKFAQIIYPYSTEVFFQEYWENKYLYISREEDLYYNDILNVNDIDLFLQNKNLIVDNENIFLVKEGQKVKSEQWTKKSNNSKQLIVDNNKLFNCLNQCVTLVINGVHKSIPKLINFCNYLENEFQFKVQTNIYITPPTSQGLEAHFDDHDVFILQIDGTKIWRLYDSPVKLPCNKNYQMTGFESLGEPKFEVELKPGDFLYIPRGLIHQACTTDSTSIHIALGLNPIYGFELLGEIVTFAQDNEAFRKAIPHGFSDDDGKKLFKDEFRKLCQSLIDNLDVDALLQKKHDKFRIDQRSEDENRFTDWLQINQINLNTILSPRKSITFTTEKDNNNNNIYIKFYDKVLKFPFFLAPSLSTILSSDNFMVKEIAGLINNEGKIKLATTFIQEGFLKIESINTAFPNTLDKEDKKNETN